MIPPRGFKAELYPLKHRILYSVGASAVTTGKNSYFFTLIRHTSDVAVAPSAIEVNPHNTNYNEETGPAVQKMSIIDKLSMSLKFNLTESAETGEISSGAFGDSLRVLKLTWRPVFFSFGEKLDATDDDTGTSVATILGLTKDATFEDVVPITTTKASIGASTLSQPMSSVNIVEIFSDYNMTTDITTEDHPWDETLFQNAIRRYTNKGALKACVGRTRHVTLTHARPFANFFIDKFVPRAVRRVVPYTFMGIQINVPTSGDIGQYFHANALTANSSHVGMSCICNYHEWNADHYQDMSGTG